MTAYPTGRNEVKPTFNEKRWKRQAVLRRVRQNRLLVASKMHSNSMNKKESSNEA